VQNILDLHAKQKNDVVELLVAQVFDLAMLTCRAFNQEQMSRFLDRSNQLLARINAENVDKN
jgi:HSP90 family molecular chaperone